MITPRLSRLRARWKWLLLLIPLLGALAFGGYVATGAARNRPMPEARAALQDTGEVTVTNEEWLTFRPTAVSPTTGFIFYPGGLVPPAAYAPPAGTIAAAGYLVVIPDMPLDLAVFNADIAAAIIAAYPQIEHWAIGGHSLGGAMAASFTHQNPAQIDGLVLWAAYPAESADLSDYQGQALSIYGTADGLALPSEIDKAIDLLPPTTDYVAIEGGNHTQFGWYGDGLQSGDNPAAIDRAKQQRQIVKNTVALLDAISSSK